MPSRPVLTVAGAGMAGLCAAARARELGANVEVYEKGDRAGGSMRISSGVIWRYRTLEDFRRECPGGNERLQRLIVERLDEGLEWLEKLGAPVIASDTGNPRTVGARFDPAGLTDALVGAAGAIEYETPLPEVREPTILATGGFQGDHALVARHITDEPILLRANRWSTGDGLRLGLQRGAAASSGMGEFYGRNMLDTTIHERGFVTMAQVYARYALVLNRSGEPLMTGEPSWSETEVVQGLARQRGARGWYVVDGESWTKRIRDDLFVGDVLAAAFESDANTRQANSLAELASGMGIEVIPASPKLNEPPFTAVPVRAAITHTIGGLRIDERARVLGADGTPVADLYAAGVDVGGIATGGYASGLAQALVLGRVAAESAVG